MSRKKTKLLGTSGLAFIQAKFNNTVISFTDSQGNTIVWSSAGACGFKGSRKGTPFAAIEAAGKAAKEAAERGMLEVIVYTKGPGGGKEAAVKEIQRWIKVNEIIDRTPIPHNGCRPPKKRRV